MYLAEELKKDMEHEYDNDSNHSWSPSISQKESKKEIGETRNQKNNWNFPDPRIAKLDTNT